MTSRSFNDLNTIFVCDHLYFNQWRISKSYGRIKPKVINTLYTQSGEIDTLITYLNWEESAWVGKIKKQKKEAYKLMLMQQKALLEGETDLIANLANSSALLNQTLQETVFAGYYLFKNDELILGLFQGNVWCVHIAMGKGVCGEAAEKNQTLIVENVLEHKNYIACDSAARSGNCCSNEKGRTIDRRIGFR